MFAIIYAEFNDYWSISYAEIKANEGMVPFVSAFKHVSPSVLFSLVRRKRSGYYRGSRLHTGLTKKTILT